jgi:hypothetical protein
VVIDDFNLVRVTTSPDKTNSILIIDSNAVLPVTGSAQLFKPISRGHAQVAYVHSGMQHQQLGICPPKQISRYKIRAVALKNCLRTLTGPCSDSHDHAHIELRGIMPSVTTYVKRNYIALVA